MAFAHQKIERGHLENDRGDRGDRVNCRRPSYRGTGNRCLCTGHRRKKSWLKRATSNKGTSPKILPKGRRAAGTSYRSKGLAGTPIYVFPPP